MNIYTLHDAVKEYSFEIIDSGFQRDLQDYVQTISQSPGNSEILRTIGNKIEVKLKYLQDSGVSNDMKLLIPKNYTQSIFEPNVIEKISSLNKDPQIKLQQYHQTLTTIVNDLNTKCVTISKNVKSIEDFLQPYLINSNQSEAEKSKAHLSLIFKDKNTITKLNCFSKEIEGWRKALPLYTALITKKSPEDIEIVNVQNGSIDVILNLDLNVACNLNEIFSTAIKGFAAFLSYKLANKKIDAAIKGNKRYAEIEQEKEQLLLENIKISVKSAIEEQVKTKDQIKTNLESIDKKIDVITTAVTNHVIKGNEIKLLSFDRTKEEIVNSVTPVLAEIKENQTEVRRDIKLIDEDTKIKLLSQYKEIKDDVA